MELWILNNKRFAFTLAEVLVTLGIIGVVSAMTVPTLMNNYQRQSYVVQLHKVYNEFSQVFERYMADQKVDTLRESDIYNSPTNLNTFVRDYIKVVKDCGTSMADCFAPSYTFINNAKVINVTGTCNKVFTMASGAVICMDVENGDGAEDAGKGIVKERDYTDIDGLITNEPGLVLSTFYADCVPLYFVDPVHRAIGMSHSGWKNGSGHDHSDET